LIPPTALVDPLPRILLVEDEPDILVTLSDCLPVFYGPGLSIEVAASGEEAQALLESGRSFDAVVSDEVMAGMDPGTARVLMTAHPEPGLRTRAQQEADVQLFVQKPFDLARFAQDLRQVLHSSVVAIP
jgi:DNA-binding NtrC family response regulator